MKINHFPNLRAEIARRGFTSKDMADALGITVGAWNRRMRGLSAFRFSDCCKLHELFPDVSWEQLLYDPI